MGYPEGNILTIRGTVARSKVEGMPVSECAVRRWIKSGELKHRMAGKKILIYWPTFVEFITCGAKETVNNRSQ